MATYYISNTGNDADDGLTIGTAWANTSKITAGTFSAGDIIVLERGGVFSPFSLSNSGSSGNPIRIGSYGSGIFPIVTSAITTSGWSSIGGGLYTYTNVSLSNTLKLVTIDGNIQAKGRFPKSTFFTITASDGATDSWVEASSLPEDYTGGQVVIRKRRFIYHTTLIDSVTGGNRINYGTDFDEQGEYSTLVGFGFFVQNHVSTLTAFGDWMYDAGTKTITMYFGAANPADYLINVTTDLDAITISSESYVDIEEILVKEVGGCGIVCDTVSNINIDNVEVASCGHDGIKFPDFTSNNSSITNSYIHDILCSGIYANYNCHNMLAEYNRVNNIGLILGASEAYANPDSKNLGICFQLGTNNTIRFNRVTNIGFNGIVNNGNNFLIHSNYVDTFNLNKDDGAGIYCSLGGTGFSITTPGNITDNICVNGIGYSLGSDDTGLVAYGMYMDDLQNNVVISGNLLAFNTGGLYLHNTLDINVTNNRFFGNKKQMNFSEDSSLAIDGIIVSNNKFYCTSPDEVFLRAFSEVNGFADWGTFSNNEYHHVQNHLGMFEVYDNGTLPFNFGRSFDEWKVIIDSDTTSTVSISQSYLPLDYTVNALLFNKTYSVSGDVTSGLGGFSFLDGATAVLNTGVVTLTKTVGGKKAQYMNFGSIANNKKYLLTLNIFSDTTQHISFNAESSYSSAYDQLKCKRITTPPSTTQFKIVLEGLSTDASDQLLWLMESDFGALKFSSVRLEEIDFTFESIMELIYNGDTSADEFSFATNMEDVDTSVVSDSFVLDPFEYAILLNTFENPDPDPGPGDNILFPFKMFLT